jgi:hypothetical protein
MEFRRSGKGIGTEWAQMDRRLPSRFQQSSHILPLDLDKGRLIVISS